MTFMQIDDVGIPANADQASGESAGAPAVFPLPIIMIIFLGLGYFMLRQVWKS